LHKILHDGSPRRHNQPCQIFISIGSGVLILLGDLYMHILLMVTTLVFSTFVAALQFISVCWRQC